MISAVFVVLVTATILTSPMVSATWIFYSTAIFRQSEYISVPFCTLSPEMRHISASSLLELLSFVFLSAIIMMTTLEK